MKQKQVKYLSINKTTFNKNLNEKTKKSQKNHKNLIKNEQKKQIFKDFLDWLNGIQEDEPIPLEVNYIYFILDFSQNDIVLSYTGDENFLTKLDYGFYSPLEGQYFDCKVLKILAQQVFIKKSRTKKQVFDLLKKVCLNVAPQVWFLKEKQIYFGLRFSKTM